MSLNQSTAGMSFFDMGMMGFERKRKKKTYFIGEPKFQFVRPTYLFDKQSDDKETIRKMGVWHRKGKKVDGNTWWLK